MLTPVLELAHIEDLCERLCTDPLTGAVLPPGLVAALDTVRQGEIERLAALDAWLEQETPRTLTDWARARDTAGTLKAAFADLYNQWSAQQGPASRCHLCGYFALGGLCAECAPLPAPDDEEAAPWNL